MSSLQSIGIAKALVAKQDHRGPLAVRCHSDMPIAPETACCRSCLWRCCCKTGGNSANASGMGIVDIKCLRSGRLPYPYKILWPVCQSGHASHEVRGVHCEEAKAIVRELLRPVILAEACVLLVI